MVEVKMMVEVLLSGVKPFTGKKRYLDAPVTSESHLNKLQHLNNSNILEFSSSSHFIYSVYCTLIIHEYVKIQHYFWLTDIWIPCLFYHNCLWICHFANEIGLPLAIHGKQYFFVGRRNEPKMVASSYMFPINTKDMQPRYFERFSSTMPHIHTSYLSRAPRAAPV